MGTNLTQSSGKQDKPVKRKTWLSAMFLFIKNRLKVLVGPGPKSFMCISCQVVFGDLEIYFVLSLSKFNHNNVLVVVHVR